MKAIQTFLFATTITLVACSNNSISKLNDLPIVAHSVEVDGQDMTVCELALLKDTIDLPLSFWVEDFEIVKLGNKDEALVGKGTVHVSDNYILIGNANNVPCKLFRRNGSFVGNVGSIGQGPGEYMKAYDIQIDEKSGCIYMLPWKSNSILVYDMNGKHIKDIPLNKKYETLIVPKGKFKVDAEKNRVAVMLLPFNFLPVVAWIQDMEGNFIHEIPMNHLKVIPAFSNEVISAKTAINALDVHIYLLREQRKDTLYHLNMETGKLQPKFTLDFGGDDIAIHNYLELPAHYVGSLSFLEQVSEISYMTYTNGSYIVEKATGKGSFYRTKNDFLDDEPVNINSQYCSNGYYTINIEPSILINKLEKALAKKSISPDKRKKLEDLLASIDEDDNNYIFIGKLKKEFGDTSEK